MNDPIIVERLIAASPEVVYTYLTEAEKWVRWQGVGAIVDPKPGGAFMISMPGGQKAVGEFIELEPDRRVVFTWGWAEHPGVPPGSTTVEIELVAQGAGTRLRLTHHGLPSDEIASHTEGWNNYVPRLAAVSEGLEPGPDVRL